MDKEEALKIAKIAYQSINGAIETLKKEYPQVRYFECCWDSCVGIDEYFFHEGDLIEE